MDNRPYVSISQIGNCRICQRREDLRCGVCFRCQDQVCGEKVNETTHRLWDRENPRNEWFYSEAGH
jgi:hypothetical protein